MKVYLVDLQASSWVSQRRSSGEGSCEGHVLESRRTLKVEGL